MAESIVNEIMDAQAEDVCADCNQRNGYRERSLMTSVGAIRPCIPKLRCGSYFPEGLIVRYSRVDRAAIAAISPRWWPWAFSRGRWSRVAQVFPSRNPLIRMFSAVFSEMDEDWAARRWFTEESIVHVSASMRPAAIVPAYDGTAKEYARRIIDVVVADNPTGRKAA